jgi:hypothetical protein
MSGPGDSAYDEPLSAFAHHAEDLPVFVLLWETRDDMRACPEARRAANDAIDAIDGALAELHKVRQLLITEIRASDDATAARVDAMLAGARGGTDSPDPVVITSRTPHPRRR